jgi:N-acetyl sugar amidotransferase
MIIKKKNIRKLYNLPLKVIFCKKCTISNQRPRITFDKEGVCSACNYRQYKAEVNWDDRKKELKKFLNKVRSKNGEYDVIVPCSGGKDGSFVAHMLKHEYGMNPLCVTWSPLAYTEIGRRNLDNFIKSGFNHILGTPDTKTLKKLTKLSFLELGDPFQPFIYGQSNFPLQIASAYNIKLIMYGENGEVEYGGDMKNAYQPTRDITDYNKHYFSNFSVDSWIKYGLKKENINPFKAPSYDTIKKKKIEMHFMGYYHKWDPQENFYYCAKNNNFQVNEERTEGTYSKYASLDDKFDGYHFYLAFIKFGIGRTTSDAAHEIRDGKITRKEGISLIKRYDTEFPNRYFSEFLEFCDIDSKLFHKIIDSWRSPHIWTKKGNKWFLKNPIWKNNN